jgi:Flp pilus assembly protein TadD
VALRPKDSRGLTHLANLLGGMGRNEEAEVYYRQATSADPSGSWPWGEYARFLVDNTARYAEAAEAATRSLATRSAADQDNDAWPWRSRGLAYLRMGQTDKARSDLAKARSIFQRYNDTWQVGQIDMILAKP